MPVTLLPHRSVLEISGQDMRTFLQGLISQNMEAVRQDQLRHSALLTPQGKFMFDLFLIQATVEPNRLLIDTERPDDLIALLEKYKLRSRVLIAKRDELRVLVSWENKLDLGGFPDPRLPALGWRHIVPAGAVPKDLALLADYDAHRMKLGVADGSREIAVEKDSLLEVNFDRLNAIDWDKGCYMGQELTARTKYRGLVKRRLAAVTASRLPAPGSDVSKDGEKIGEMRGVNGEIGLALINVGFVKEFGDIVSVDPA